METILTLHLYRRFRKWWLRLVGTVDHQTVLGQVDEDGTPTYSYAFMVTISAGIAIIGLLLNSPAVIIGAMLVSPLMGPIVLSGIALSTLNYATARKSATGLAIGIMLALSIAILIVLVSPITDPTPEILARTRPNLFDLLVAILSGLAGGYAVIRGRGGAIVGVAIATALMPPLTVVGYGIATWQLAVARGATLLFITNMLAIGMSVAFVATWYGFGRRGLRRELAWQSGIALLILLPLSIPLVLTLQSIAEETHISRVARQALEESMLKNGIDSRISQFQPVFQKGHPARIDAVVLTQEVQANLVEQARTRAVSALGSDLRFHIDQVVVSDVSRSATPASSIANPVQPTATAPQRPVVEESLRKAFPLETESLAADEAAKRMRILPKPGKGADILSLFRMQQTLAARFSGWEVSIVAPAQPLPTLYFERRKTTLLETEEEKLQAIAWALHGWQASKLRITGHASTRGSNNARLAASRAQTIGQMLKQAGFDVVTEARYPLPNQRKLERDIGYEPFRSVEILLLDNSPSRNANQEKPPG